jgi:NAD(P)-dependent dehydrogenase (short-subunit alcohol dehydrogenase family)
VTRAACVDEFVAFAVERLGRPDIRRNNAGARLADNFITDLTDDEWDRPQ